MLTFKEIGIEVLEPHKKQAEKEGLLFSSGVVYYGLFNTQNNLLGFCGIKFSKVPVFKNDYVLHQFRGNKYLIEMNKHRLAILKAKGFNSATANCTAMALNSHLHFKNCKAITKFKNGITKVHYENISKI